MKKLVLTSVAVVALMIAGCSKKEPEVAQTGVVMTDAERLAALANQIQGQVQNVYFAFDKYNVDAQGKVAANNNAALFNQAGAQALKIKVEGNCDEWGTDEYNYALGLKRAKAAKDALVFEGVNPSRIDVVSFGESNPVCTERSKSCDAQNRRSEFRVSY
ncbi:OmpA family protein [Campylobacter corcagiensis]|uniref:Peptidoglycan-associated lipoprotein n=1 Tax=Campylobacter corcagiensis TaxID=1448857 RepID=A0A7M1LGK8_9BACT|nr:OmpA family protein [Campylobacter corcagiensis]QKF65240.1 Tol-Pal system peptidoglycan-associated lipoprotein [Campylobacter corcagiensis]QOQ86625.1 OmpA family protein [Campylobacter corcagiensis]